MSAPDVSDFHNPPADTSSPEPCPGWDLPLPCDWPTSLPGWPQGVFPAVVENWVTALAEETQTPSDLPGSAALGIIGSAVGGRVRVQCPTWTEPTNIWTVPVLAPGSRKSAVIERARRPLDIAEAALIEDVREEILNKRTEREILEKHADQCKTAAAKDPTPVTIQAAQEAVRDAAEVEVPNWPRLVTSDATPEKFGSMLAMSGGRLAAISAEAGVFSSLTGRYSKTPNLDPMLQAHAGDTIIVDRQTRDPERVEAPALSVLASIQPYAMQEMMSRPDFVGRGLLARVLWCLPVDLVGRRKVRGVEVMPPEIATAYQDLITTLAIELAARDVVTLALTTPAKEALLDYAEQVERWLLPDAELGSVRATREWGSKLVGAVARIAGCLHASEGMQAVDRPISADTMQNAIRLGNYFKAHAVAAMAPTDAGRASITRYVLEKLIEHDMYDFKVRDLQRKVQKKLPSAAAVRGVLEDLANLGWVREGGAEFELYPDAKSLLTPGDKGDKGDSDTSSQVNAPSGGSDSVTPPGDKGDRNGTGARSVTLVTPSGDNDETGRSGADLHKPGPVTLVTPVTRPLALANSDDLEGEWSA